MLDVIHTQQKMLHDQDVLFALSLVDKFRELDQDQRSLAQTEIIQILQRAKRHAGIPGLHVTSTLQHLPAREDLSNNHNNTSTSDSSES